MTNFQQGVQIIDMPCPMEQADAKALLPNNGEPIGSFMKNLGSYNLLSPVRCLPASISARVKSRGSPSTLAIIASRVQA